MSVEKIFLGNLKKLICIDQSRLDISHTPDNSKMFNITPKYLAFLIINHLQAESRI